MERSIKISNLKGLLIFLVVFGHFLELSKFDSYELFTFIYAFHMPLFIFISGYLAKRVRFSKIVNLIILYLIFQTIFNFYNYFIGIDESISFHYGTPQYHLWYIVGLGVWYTIALIISKLGLSNSGKLIMLLGIFVLCFMSRWFAADIVSSVQKVYENFDTYTLSYQRTLSFAPFFFVGYFMSNHSFKKLSELIKSDTVKMFVTLSSMLCLFLYFQSNTLEDAFRGSFGALRFSDGSFNDFLLISLFQYVVSGFLCILVLNLVTHKQSILTRFGDHSLTVFLFHPLFVFLLRKYMLQEDWESDTQIVLYLLLAMLVSYFLSSKIFVKSTKYLCNPYSFINKLVRLPKRSI